LKDRKLFKVLGSKGIEGDKDDDWQLVNCGYFLVHIMLAGELEG
jgi:ribosomal silencing factor RsfS